MEQQDFTIEAAISQQIAIEQSLRATRMTWNLTFQGFMIAAFALVAAENMNPARIVLELTICGAGTFVGLGTYLGIWAAQRQSNYLKGLWNDASPYPRPFSRGGGALMGRLPTHIICVTIIAMWGALIWILVCVPLDINDCKAKFGQLGPILCRATVEARQI